MNILKFWKFFLDEQPDDKAAEQLRIAECGALEHRAIAEDHQAQAEALERRIARLRARPGKQP